MTFLFSSESVSDGHPDKVCDQISDGILDACLEQDPNSRVAAETFATGNTVIVGGEITTKANINIENIVRETLREIGYTNPDFGIDADTCKIQQFLREQSPDIAQGVNKNEGKYKEAGAGDQGMMFGYACKQTDTLMPLPIYLSHELLKKVRECRTSGKLPYLRPDSKSQITIEYENRQTPKRVHTIVISTQHDPNVSQEQLEKDLIENCIHPLIPKHLLDENTRIFINPTGKFVIGGPLGDAGLTGRKIIVDTYGGWACHGGGAFSGKDSTKVDRSAAYMARYIAKNIVAANIAEEVQIQLAYAIGVADPVSIHVETFKTSKLSDKDIVSLIKEVFKLTPDGIIETLELRKPVFKQTASFGHFGRPDIDLKWEKTDKKEVLMEKANLLALA